MTRSLPLALAAALATAACRTAPAPAAPAAWELESPLQPLAPPPPGVPFDLARARGVRVTPEKVRLGRWLFFDPRLSRGGTVACATCHDPRHAFSELRPHSTGVEGRQGTRKAPPLVNVAFPLYEAWFWDGRAASLAEQAKGPLVNPVEMDNTLEAVVATVAAVPGYRRAFREAYGDGRLDIDRIADALAAYQATRRSGGSAYDRYQAGDDGALSEEARRGMEVFFGRGRCNACHAGPNLTDGKFHNVGIGFDPGPDAVRLGFQDAGRYAVTGDPRDVGAFKTPTLREVARHPPYMHDGSSPDLRDAVLRYFEIADNPWLDPAMREVRIFPFDVRPLVAFLEALDGTGFEDEPPRSFPR
ncbi:cytochrome-c peroxidase [Anaeromyxobacter diazotrophicus]|uniref:Cytochrome c551 peroxidase n=1 Tax=Anaeromyxobacter diazotrophicus TaxID=2590199 RepID=A0A7I9VQW2_9BACT|nr:cytochrome c peroxidase [Anaeromyxobacter diazotrophicus]GEJ58806.1 cytochrome c551 peroxidase [Anaeromyxobacter diazotrophicus]